MIRAAVTAFLGGAWRLLARAYRNRPIVIWPPLAEDAELNDALFKAAYMFPGRTVFYAGLPPERAAKPAYLAATGPITDVRHAAPGRLLLRALLFHVVLLRRCRTRRHRAVSRLPQVFNVDPRANPGEGWQYFYAYNLVSGNLGADPPAPQRIDFSLYPRRPACFAFGSGRSLATACQHDFGDGYRIVCNSMIRDLPLMERIRPDFLVFADGIYHFGPSTYAQAFRDALGAFSRRFPACRLVIPQNLSHHFLACHPELRGRTFVVPRARRAGIIVDWRRTYAYHRIGNVLNMMIIPLATSLADQVFFLGFDGRTPQARRFWSYSPGANFDDLLADQERAHPAFFSDRDYEQHARRFYAQTEEIFRAGEASGIRYASLAPSSNPAMDRRRLAGASRFSWAAQANSGE